MYIYKKIIIGFEPMSTPKKKISITYVHSSYVLLD